MSKDILIKDNFLDDIDTLRKVALSQRFIYHLDAPTSVGWRGYRTWEISYLKEPIVQECREKVLHYCCEHYNVDSNTIAIETYFHISCSVQERQRLKRWHRDDQRHAGVIYLTPNAPLNAGTTVFINDKAIEIENKYNRLILYPGFNKHGPTYLFGDGIDDGRMTVTFFIGDKEETESQINYINMIREARG